MAKTALITGAAKGIGRAAALELARRGYRVCIHYNTSEEEAERTRAEAVDILRAQEGDVPAEGLVICLKADLRSGEEVRTLADRLISAWGCPDVIVNNAGVSQIAQIQDVTEDQWDLVQGSDLKSVYQVIRAFIPAMIERKSGSIVNVSSMWGQVGGSCESVYSAAKGGVISFTKALAKELGPSGIRVNCVAPGCIMTDMMKDFSAETLRELAEETPLGRIGEPEEAAKAIAFLASEDASFITGQVLGVNGGMVI